MRYLSAVLSAALISGALWSCTVNAQQAESFDRFLGVRGWTGTITYTIREYNDDPPGSESWFYRRLSASATIQVDLSRHTVNADSTVSRWSGKVTGYQAQFDAEAQQISHGSTGDCIVTFSIHADPSNTSGGSDADLIMNFDEGIPSANTFVAQVTQYMPILATRSWEGCGSSERNQVMTPLSLIQLPPIPLPMTGLHLSGSADSTIRWLSPIVAETPGPIVPIHFSWDFTPYAADAPTCDIELSQTTFSNGETVTANVLTLGNPTAAPLPIEFKFWVDVPTFGPISFWRGGADGSVALPAGFNHDFGHVRLFMVESEFPRGQYSFHCRLLDPVTGRVQVDDSVPFTVQ